MASAVPSRSERSGGSGVGCHSPDCKSPSTVTGWLCALAENHSLKVVALIEAARQQAVSRSMRTRETVFRAADRSRAQRAPRQQAVSR